MENMQSILDKQIAQIYDSFGDSEEFREIHHFLRNSILMSNELVTSTITFKDNRYPLKSICPSKWLIDRLEQIANHLSHWGTYHSFIIIPEFHKDNAMHFHLIVSLRNYTEFTRIKKSLGYFGLSKFDKADLSGAIRYYKYMIKHLGQTEKMINIYDLHFTFPMSAKELYTQIYTSEDL